MTAMLKNILTMLFVVGGTYLLYVLVSNPDLRARMFPSAQVIEEQTAKLEDEVLKDLRSMEAITIDTELFTLPEYKALEETPITIQPVPVSRQNPFAPF